MHNAGLARRADVARGAGMTTRHRSGRHFLQIPGPTNVPGPHPARHRPPDHRPSRARVRAARRRGPRRHQADLQDQRARGDLSRLRHRRLGSGAGQHAVAGRPGADGRDRPFRDPVAQMAERLGLEAGVHARRLAARRRSGSGRSQRCARTAATDQGGLRRPQRDLDRRHLAASPRSARDRPRRPPGAASWSTPSPRSPRSTTATTSGASTSRSAARRRA